MFYNFGDKFALALGIVAHNVIAQDDVKQVKWS
jgi:hypothetical protein